MGLARRLRGRLHGRLLPIVQTAVAAVTAWYLAGALVPDPRPSFAAIAAVIAVGATHGQRRDRAVQLVGGVVIGITAASLLTHVIGVGGLQLGLLVVLAMSAAVLVGGGELLVVEAAVSAILLVALDPSASDDFSPNRILEAVIGGGTALAVSSIFFPPDPALAVGRAAQAVFGQLGRTLERIAVALDAADLEIAQAALVEARGIDARLAEMHTALDASRETARLAPPRRAARAQLDRYERAMTQVDYAVRNTRVMARHVLRVVRSGETTPELAAAVRPLGESVWELAAAFDDVHRAAAARRLAVEGAARATELHAGGNALALAELVGQVRMTAVDLVRAADVLADGAGPADERPTEELLVIDAA